MNGQSNKLLFKNTEISRHRNRQGVPELKYRHSLIYDVNVGTHTKKHRRKNPVNRGYLVVLKGRKIEWNYKPRQIKNSGNRGMPVVVFEHNKI